VSNADYTVSQLNALIKEAHRYEYIYKAFELNEALAKYDGSTYRQVELDSDEQELYDAIAAHNNGASDLQIAGKMVETLAIKVILTMSMVGLASYFSEIYNIYTCNHYNNDVAQLESIVAGIVATIKEIGRHPYLVVDGKSSISLDGTNSLRLSRPKNQAKLLVNGVIVSKQHLDGYNDNILEEFMKPENQGRSISKRDVAKWLGIDESEVHRFHNTVDEFGLGVAKTWFFNVSDTHIRFNPVVYLKDIPPDERQHFIEYLSPSRE
jgi:hypothetical protein